MRGKLVVGWLHECWVCAVEGSNNHHRQECERSPFDYQTSNRVAVVVASALMVLAGTKTTVPHSSSQSKGIDDEGPGWKQEKVVGWKSWEAAFECQRPQGLELMG